MLGNTDNQGYFSLYMLKSIENTPNNIATCSIIYVFWKVRL